MRLIGLPLKVGDRTRDVRVSASDLSLVLPLEQSQGKVRVFITVPSLDIPACTCVARKFSQNLNALAQDLGESVAVFLISADLPFAQARWQTVERIVNMTMFSDYRDMDFARNWGLLIQEMGLLTCAVYIVDSKGIVTYREIVSELTAEPDYEGAIAALKAIL